MKSKSQSRQEARRLYEKINKICILPGMHLHHMDGNPYNNSISNLVVCTPEEHLTYHRALGDKISKSGFILKANNSLGRPCKEETKEKIREALRQKTISEDQRLQISKTLGGQPFLVFNKNTGEFIKEYHIKAECNRELGVGSSKIRNCLNGIRHSAKQYYFIYTSHYNGDIDIVEEYKSRVASGMERMRQSKLRSNNVKKDN